MTARPLSELVDQAWEYFRNEQGMKQEYIPMVTEEDSPATYLNKEKMDEFKEELKKYYFDETKYNSYLEQLGIEYPTLKKKE